jgi:hypothetical protein
MCLLLGIWIGMGLSDNAKNLASLIYLPVIFAIFVGACIKVVIHHYRQKLRKADEQ